MAQTQEKTMEASTAQAEAAKPTAAQAQTPAPNEATEYPKDLYDQAHVENSHIDFNQRITAARTTPVKEYVTPDIPVGIMSQIEAEMAAGAKRVAEFAEQEKLRKAIPRTPDKWEGKNTPVFRPDNVSEYKDTLKSQAQTVSKDAVRQPPRK